MGLPRYGPGDRGQVTRTRCQVSRRPPHQAPSALLELLLGADVGGVPAGLLPAVGGAGVQARVALPAQGVQVVWCAG